MTDLRVLGIDPGPTPGLVLLDLNDRATGEGRWLDGFEVLQCSAGLLLDVLEGLLSRDFTPALVQVERFVTGRRSGRSAHASAGTTTRDLVGAIEGVVRTYSLSARGETSHSVQRSAAAVKPWGTDERLDAADLLTATKGMTHARDAARHALFAACHDGGLPDPLSKEFKR